MAKLEEKGNCMKGVFITVYVESQQNSNNPIKKLKANQFTNARPKRSGYYDRRAQLLAYAKELREASSPEKVQWLTGRTRNSPGRRYKIQERWLEIPRRIRSSIRVILNATKRRWNYERIISDEDTQRKKRKSTSRRNTHFRKRLVCMIKQVSCGWRCNKGV